MQCLLVNHTLIKLDILYDIDKFKKIKEANIFALLKKRSCQISVGYFFIYVLYYNLLFCYTSTFLNHIVKRSVHIYLLEKMILIKLHNI